MVQVGPAAAQPVAASAGLQLLPSQSSAGSAALSLGTEQGEERSQNTLEKRQSSCWGLHGHKVSCSLPQHSALGTLGSIG